MAGIVLVTLALAIGETFLEGLVRVLRLHLRGFTGDLLTGDLGDGRFGHAYGGASMDFARAKKRLQVHKSYSSDIYAHQIRDGIRKVDLEIIIMIDTNLLPNTSDNERWLVEALVTVCGAEGVWNVNQAGANAHGHDSSQALYVQVTSSRSPQVSTSNP